MPRRVMDERLFECVCLIECYTYHLPDFFHVSLRFLVALWGSNGSRLFLSFHVTEDNGKVSLPTYQRRPKSHWARITWLNYVSCLKFSIIELFRWKLTYSIVLVRRKTRNWSMNRFLWKYRNNWTFPFFSTVMALLIQKQRANVTLLYSKYNVSFYFSISLWNVSDPFWNNLWLQLNFMDFSLYFRHQNTYTCNCLFSIL